MKQESEDVQIIRPERGQKFSISDLLDKARFLWFHQERLYDPYLK